MRSVALACAITGQVSGLYSFQWRVAECPSTVVLPGEGNMPWNCIRPSLVSSTAFVLMPEPRWFCITAEPQGQRASWSAGLGQLRYAPCGRRFWEIPRGPFGDP